MKVSKWVSSSLLLILTVYSQLSLGYLGTVRLRDSRLRGSQKYRPSSKIATKSVNTAIEPTETTLQGPFRGLITDIKNRSKCYKSDWTDGFSKKSISAIVFLFFTCFAPIVAFGGLTSIITDGTMGVIQFIISCGFSGMVYALFAGQPLTFQGPTGLSLAFITALHNFTTARNLPFLAIYCWTGLWTSLFLALCSIFNVCDLIKHCTPFTDDSFNALLSVNFLYEAAM